MPTWDDTCPHKRWKSSLNRVSWRPRDGNKGRWLRRFQGRFFGVVPIFRPARMLKKNSSSPARRNQKVANLACVLLSSILCVRYSSYYVYDTTVRCRAIATFSNSSIVRISSRKPKGNVRRTIVSRAKTRTIRAMGYHLGVASYQRSAAAIRTESIWEMSADVCFGKTTELPFCVVDGSAKR